MADLEDFFAKRDKKKKAKGKAFEATDVKGILEAKAKERKSKETHKSTYQPTASEQPEPSDYKASEGDDEWKEVVDEKPDFSGLKIQELVLESSEDEAKEGEDGADGAEKEGPWTKVKPVTHVTPLAEVIAKSEFVKTMMAPDPDEVGLEPEKVEGEEGKTPEEEPGPEGELSTEKLLRTTYVPPSVRKALEEAAAMDKSHSSRIIPAAPPPSELTPKVLGSAGGGAYVPPSRRLGATPSSGSGMGGRPRKSAAAPNINDEQYFPSLGDALSGKTPQKS